MGINSLVVNLLSGGSPPAIPDRRHTRKRLPWSIYGTLVRAGDGLSPQCGAWCLDLTHGRGALSPGHDSDVLPCASGPVGTGLCISTRTQLLTCL